MRPLAGACLAVDGEAWEDSSLSPGIAPRLSRGHQDPCSPSPGLWLLLCLCATHQAALADRIKANVAPEQAEAVQRSTPGRAAGKACRR